jgi:hypothetical protein
VSDLTATTNFSTCLPLSLLLSSSSSFRNTLWDSANDSDYRYLNNLIAYTHSPQPSAEECDANFAQYYEEMPQKSNCAADLSNSATKAAASQALRGLGNYQVIRTASGFVNPDSGVYCYLEAVASERPDDLYLWQLPAGNM